MKYTIYKTINIINNKFYIGLHVTENPYDNYLGSGILLKKAIKKYGRKNFKKEVLHIFDNKIDMINKEIELVNETLIKNTKSYNYSKGGFGLSTLGDKKRIETIEKIRKSHKERCNKESSCQRLKTMLNKDKHIFKKIGNKSSITQKLKYKNGYINPRTDFTIINIYNEKDEKIYSFPRCEMTKICNKNNLPVRVFIKSLHNNGTPIYYSTPPLNAINLKYRCWYALSSKEKRVDLNIFLRNKRDLNSMKDYLSDKKEHIKENESFIIDPHFPS